MKRIVVGPIALALFFCCRLLEPSNVDAIETGRWEMNMETRMEGLPFAMPPTVVTVTQCISQKDLIPKDPNAKNCTFKNLKTSGNKVSWEYECSQDGSKVTGRGEMNYSGSTCSGTQKTVITSEGQKMTATTKMTGKRLGKCSGEEQSISINGKDLKKQQEQAKQMTEIGKRLEEQREADKQRSLQLIGKISVPKERPDACIHYRNAYSGDTNANTECDDRWGDLNIREGEWEITEETTGRMGELINPVITKTSRSCLSPYNEPSYPGIAEVLKRNGNTVTWSKKAENSGIKSDVTGGMDYRGDTFEGAVIDKTVTTGGTHTRYTRITGRRIGDGDCIGRDMTAKKIRMQKAMKKNPDGSSTDSGENGQEGLSSNPVRKLRSIFGF